jgi:hypothetical protein
MNERIQELAISTGLYDSLCDPYDKHGTGDPYSSVMDDLEKFALLIVRECAKRVDYWESRQGEHCEDLLKHFGVTNESKN